MATVFRLSATGATRSITGLDPTGGHSRSGTIDGRYIILWNVGSFDIVLKHQDAASAVANRFLVSDGSDVTIAPDAHVKLWYDQTTLRWRLNAPPVGPALLQIRETGTFAPGAGIVKLTFNTTDIENDAATIEHNNTTTSRIDIKVTGFYKILFQSRIRVDPAGGGGNPAACDLRFRLNNTSNIPGSIYEVETFEEGGKEQTTDGSREVIASLTAGDFVEIEVDETLNGIEFSENHMVTVMKL